tara:strand:+ start:758 stop:1396 length:639 start_codon:yes stop_codon:yes gene_type:complete
MLSGILVYYSWLRTVQRQLVDGKPPMLRPVDRFRSDGHKGKQVELFDDDNVLYVVGYFYAGDEAEALAVCQRIEKIRNTFSEEKRFLLVGFSMDPKLDSAELLRKFASKHGFTSDEWLFVTGDRDRVRKFMNKFFRYPGHKKPDKFRETDSDLYARELRISLVHKDQNDDRAFIRGVYWEGIRKGEVRNDESSKQDIEFILQNEMKQSSKKK